MTIASTIDATPVANRTAALPVVRRILDRLHDEAVTYCHWKSNEHLAPALEGITDLDILVDRHHALAFARVMAEEGFKRFRTAPSRTYPGIEDYLGFDGETGRLVHLHVHYQLTLGAQYIKGHRLPWEARVLATRTFDAEHGVYVAAPEVEIVLLAVRSALKLRVRDRLGAPASPLGTGARREWSWLMARVQALRVLRVAEDLLDARGVAALAPLLSPTPPSGRQLAAFRRALRPLLRAAATFSPGRARARRWGQELLVLSARVRRALGGRSPDNRRTVLGGGVLIAFVGADGAGKSTAAGAIAKWLGWKVAVSATYGGSGVGSAMLPRRVLRRAASMLFRRRRSETPVPRLPAARDRADRDAGLSPLATAKRIVWALALTRERFARFEEAQRARNLGTIVLWDRFPQTQFPGLNDGPRLTGWLDHPSALLRAVARYEASAFELADRCAPDVVVKLTVPFDVARRRKPDTPPDQLRRKLEIVGALRYPATTRVVEIDTARPLDAVHLDIKRTVWSAL